MNIKALLMSGSFCVTVAYMSWANPPEPLDAPARALEASRAANLPAPVLLWENGAPGAKGDSDEDKPAIYPFLPTKESAKVITAARSLKASAHSRRSSLLVGALIGLILGAIAAIVADTRVRTA